MGVTFLDIPVSNPAKPRARKELRFLVDSGALYSVLPASELKLLGIEATSSEEFTLANGERIRMRVGNANFEYAKKIRAAPVVFGKAGVFLLGVTTLEALGLMLDPIRRELKPVPMLLMHKAAATVAMTDRRVIDKNHVKKRKR